MEKLFEPFRLGRIELKNRIVMAPMTRSRAIKNVPNKLMVQYYGSRASAGLIVTEGTSPSPNGLGYSRIPGLFNSEQVEGWHAVTQAVHAGGGRIFVQLMHTGRVGHPLNMPKGSRILAPSPVTVEGTMWTDDQGPLPHPQPEEMTAADISQAIGEFVQSAKLAIEGGFDGVELHGANGYLIEQFLNPNSNQRSDAYGATDEGRMRFLLEVARLTSEAIGADRVGVRLSPYGTFNGMGAFPGIDAFYTTLARNLSELSLAYVHVVDHSAMGAPPVSPEVKRLIRSNFKGAYILSGGYSADSADADLVAGHGDLVAFGRPFIANPDFVDRIRDHRPLKDPDPNKFYTPGPEGYTIV